MQLSMKNSLRAGGSERPQQLSPVIQKGHLAPPDKPGILKPVKGPSGGRGHSGSERMGYDLSTPQKMPGSMMHNISPKSTLGGNGYMSQSDAGSARLSNVQTFKYNPVANIRKVSPQVGNTMEYSSGGEQKFLPNI